MAGTTEGAASLFERLDGNIVVPTALSRGPWDPRSLHGGPVAALIAQGGRFAHPSVWAPFVLVGNGEQ